MSQGILAANKQLRTWYFSAYIFGFICILIVTNAPNLEPFWITIVSLIPMGFYIGYGSRLSKKHHDEVGFADSVYYLGFTLTLTSLFFAIVNEKMQLLGGDGAGTDQTLTLFGFALATTIVGIVYRTMNTQFLYQENTLPKGEAERISSEIDQFSQSMNALRDGIKEVSTLVSDDLPGILTAAKPIQETIQRISNDLNSQDLTIDKSVFKRIENEFVDVNAEFEKSIKNLSQHLNSQKIDASLFNKLSTNLDNLNGKFERMNNKFTEMITSQQRAVNAMNNISRKTLSEVNDVNRELDGMKESFFQMLKRRTIG